MRLFQSTVCIEEFEPPPPFLTDPTRENLKNITQFRDGRHRVATPEKLAIMELSTSFEKRRLGKQQQILSEMSQRCREQEVADLSSKLSAKCQLESVDKGKTREVTFYTTNFMHKRPKFGYMESEIMESPRATPTSNSKPVFEKTYKHFPARKIIKHQGKFDFSRTNTKFSILKTPRIDPSPVRALVTQALSDNQRKTKLLQSHRINGPIQLDHYIGSKSDHLAPLVLPTIESSLQEKIEAFSTSRCNLETRSKTNIDNTMNGSQSNKSSTKGNGRNVKPPITEQAEQVITTATRGNSGGHTPPPNSVDRGLEIEAN